VYARILAYIQGRFTVDTYVRRYIRVHVCYTHPYIPTLNSRSFLPSLYSVDPLLQDKVKVRNGRKRLYPIAQS